MLLLASVHIKPTLTKASNGSQYYRRDKEIKLFTLGFTLYWYASAMDSHPHPPVITPLITCGEK
jgi:hypothetical protein